MRPTATTTAAAYTARAAAERAVGGGFRRWNSPVLYLFCGLAMMLGLLAVALAILSCLHRNTSNDDAAGGDDGRKAAEVANEQNIAVIMAGDDNPTYLAIPLPAAVSCASQQV
ncbi:hypothetical protein Nepgr_029092 [Nepenthes gracilis]|uniref:Uncharacterized protein n=1 Tax=Nepenthes gracilis TaxID=150966 RepID=A0AAD3TDG5_NEPGR|nr:hypothetical protein Nepgr_029092 [Nepenthes gracilis]